MRVHQYLKGKKRSNQRHSWLFNLPFVPCCEPQENPVMVAISCVFNMQDTHERTYLALGGDASISLLTWLQIIIIIFIRRFEFFSLFVILLSREAFPIHIPCSFTFFRCFHWGFFFSLFCHLYKMDLLSWIYKFFRNSGSAVYLS